MSHLRTYDVPPLLVLVNTATRTVVERCVPYATCAVRYDDKYLPSCTRCGEALRPTQDKAEMVNIYTSDYALMHAEPCSIEALNAGLHKVNGNVTEWHYA